LFLIKHDNHEENKWTRLSWKEKSIRHQPPYEDTEELRKVLDKIDKVPGIVEVERIHTLRNQLKECGEGKRMLVHLGDCSETFKDCNEESITNRIVLYTLWQLLMKKLLNKPITKIGRIAGQYAKPRSSPTESLDGEIVNSYFGDNVNKFQASKTGRIPDPKRLLEGYHWSITTYHSIKKIEEEWNFDVTLSNILEAQLRDIETIDRESEEYLNFNTSIKEWFEENEIIEDMFISHEGLILDYESRFTRLLEAPDKDKKVNLKFH